MSTKKKILAMFAVIVGGMATGFVLLVLVCCIPSEWIKENVVKSAAIIKEQGVYPDLYLKGRYIDNWTDGDCLAMVWTCEGNPIVSALNPVEWDSLPASENGVETLQNTINGIKGRISNRGYMWQGFRIWLRPLLVLGDISEIRCLTVAINMTLFLVICVLLWKMNRKYTMISFAIAFSYFNFQMESLSLLFFNDICVMQMGILLVLFCIRHRKNEYLEIGFAGIGVLVAFSSMLIMPMLTIGFPLIIWISVAPFQGTSLLKRIFDVIKYSLCWLIGYAVTLLTKIALSATADGIPGLRKILFYSGIKNGYSILGRLYVACTKVLHVFIQSKFLGMLLILLISVLCVKILYKKRLSWGRIQKQIPYFLLVCYPVIWVIVMAQHANHGWTVFNFSISIFAGLQILFDILHSDENRAG